MGPLVPCHVQEALPGDRYRINTEAMFRMMPMVAPIMHKVDIYFHSFFVPNRLLWDHWENYITGGEFGDPQPALPTLDLGAVDPSSLANYLGVPASTTPVGEVNALPFAAYYRIWHDFYRDQNLQIEQYLPLTDGVQGLPNSTELVQMRKRAWEHDYFTSALPFAQKGAAVDVPFDGSNLSIHAVPPGATPSGNNPLMRNSATGAPLGGAAGVTVQNTNAFGSTTVDAAGTQYPTYLDPQETLQISGTGSTTVNDLRTAFSLQKWLEKNARAGTRYVENLLAHFGVRSSDARLQRPEYIGGSKASMAISEVLQTSSTDTTTPQANMAGHGASITAGRDSVYSCEEHGYILTLVSIRPKTNYFQGMPRHFMKRDRTEYYWPDFAFLGEQPVYNGELLWKAANSDFDTWGYLPRYTEYRFNTSRVAGQMATTLDYWHLARKFNPAGSVPPLNDDFIMCSPDKRVFADTNPDDDEIVAHIYHKIMAQRPIPLYGTPGIF